MRTYNKLIKKVVICLSIFLIYHNTANAQFLNKDAEWIVNYSGIGGDSYVHFKIDKDSLINDTMYSIFDKYGTISAIREDSLKTYYKVIQHNESQGVYDTLEHILYDFSLKLNDSIQLNLPHNSYEGYWKVINVDSVLVGDKYKRRLFLRRTSDMYGPDQYWIEDIGSTFGPLCFMGITEGEMNSDLHCYSINDKKLYGNCILVGVSPEIKKNNNIVFLNHSQTQIKIKLPSHKNCILSVYSINGTMVICKKIPCNQYIDMEFLKTGIYIFEVKADNLKHSKKIIIK